MSAIRTAGYLTCTPCRTDRVAVTDFYDKDLGRGVKRPFVSGNCPSCGDLVEARQEAVVAAD